MDTTKKCPKCREEIQKDARECKHCQADLRNWFSRHKIITSILALFILVVVLGAIGSNNSDTGQKSSSNETAKTVEKKDTFKTGENVDVGYFTYNIKSDNILDKEELGNFIKKKPDGIFKVIGMSVYNKDKESRYLDSVMFRLLDNQGRKYDVSTEGTTALSEMSAMSDKDFDLFLKQVSPSLWVNGAVVFDIPKDAEGLKLEVSGGFGSPEKKYIELQ